MTSALSAAEVGALRASLERGRAEVVVLGRSMHPTLREGERLEIVARRPRPGEIALYVRRGRLVVHRLERIEYDLAWLRGDANVRRDPPVALAELLGVVVAVTDHRDRRRTPAGPPLRRAIVQLARRTITTLLLRRGG